MEPRACGLVSIEIKSLSFATSIYLVCRSYKYNGPAAYLCKFGTLIAKCWHICGKVFNYQQDYDTVQCFSSVPFFKPRIDFYFQLFFTFNSPLTQMDIYILLQATTSSYNKLIDQRKLIETLEILTSEFLQYQIQWTLKVFFNLEKNLIE